ncbi:MAG: histidine phosphatase family protein [Desulfobacteraceae bacterium]|nr:histidine phosphatase family protein [Desulfobacteraceae bacterium]
MITQIHPKCCGSRRQCRHEVPTGEKCRELWTRYGLSDEIAAHSETVAELARILAIYLNRAGLHLDVDLVVAAGLLHDLDKGGPLRSAVSAGLLLELGYPDVAKAVTFHTHQGGKEAGAVDETDLVHLADRLLWGDRPMPLDRQTGLASDLYASHPFQFDALSKHLREAGVIQRRVEALLHCSVEEIVQRHRRGLQAASVRGPRDVYLVRPGAVRQGEGDGRFSRRADAALSPEGVRQAEALCRELGGVPFSAVYCSDLRRSVDVARTIAGPRHLNPRVCEGLRGICPGEWENLSFEEIARRYPGDVERMRRDRLNFRPPGGESYMDCALRVIPAFLEILRSHRGNLLIVGHGSVNRIILCQAMGLPMERLFDFGQDHGCLNVIGARDAGFELKAVNRGPDVGRGTSGTAEAAEFVAGLRVPRPPCPGSAGIH